ncbi:MAG: glycosyltransferase family 1 protein [Phycisphaerae bacterium]|nr:glycosyltransferase family 1 protein [Phycisphaerae bacterium]
MSNNYTIEMVPPDYAVKLMDSWPGQELLSKNLEALATVDAELAEAIADFPVGNDVEMVVGYDGAMTFMVRQDDGSIGWLGYTSVPTIAAEQQKKRIDFQLGSLAIDGIVNGYYLEAILHSMSKYMAVFVTENNLLHLKLAFELHDFAEYIINRNLIIIFSDEPTKAVADFFEANPDFNALTQSLAWPWLKNVDHQKYMQVISQAMSEHMNTVLQDSKKLVDEIKTITGKRLSDTLRKCIDPANDEKLRVINCTQTLSSEDYHVGKDLINGFSQTENVQANFRHLTSPKFMSPLSHLRRLEQYQPELILIVNKLRKDFTNFLPDQVCLASIMTEGGYVEDKELDDLTEKINANDFIFCCNQKQIDKFKQAHIAATKICLLSPGANEQLYYPVPTKQKNDIVIMHNRVNMTLKDSGVVLPTHELLINTVINNIMEQPGNFNSETIGKFLVRGQDCGIKIRDKGLVEHFSNIIGKYLGPSVVVDSYSQMLLNKGYNLDIYSGVFSFGKYNSQNDYWEQSVANKAYRGAIKLGSEDNEIYNKAKIVLNFSLERYPEQNLLNAIAAGALVMVKSHPGHNKSDGLGAMFKLNHKVNAQDTEIITFDSHRDLAEKIKLLLNDPQRRDMIANNAREKLLSEHTYKHRALTIRKFIVNNL